MTTQVKRFLKDRTLATLALAVLLIVLMGATRPPVKNGLYPNAYWASKGNWRHCADILLIGDSRTLIGVSPEEMQKNLPDSKVYNYGFGGAWYSTQYLDKVETILNPQNNKPIIIAGITPRSLTRRNERTGNFYEIMSLPKCERFFNIRLARLAYFFEPWSLKDAIDEINPLREKNRSEVTFHPDGWISVREDSRFTEKELKKYIAYYKERIVDPCNVDNVVRYVEKWVERGIHVYGFMPPSCQEMYDLETKISGLDEQDLIHRFEQAGGIWIDIDPDAYESYDGTHLPDEEARQFTRDLCNELIRHESQKRIRIHHAPDKLNN